jgi:hypothetical protein
MIFALVFEGNMKLSLKLNAYWQLAGSKGNTKKNLKQSIDLSLNDTLFKI